MEEDELEIHELEVNGISFRISNDPWTGDWSVEQLDNDYRQQPIHLKSKEGAINFCLVEGSVVKKSEVEYQYAPDRTSA